MVYRAPNISILTAFTCTSRLLQFMLRPHPFELHVEWIYTRGIEIRREGLPILKYLMVHTRMEMWGIDPRTSRMLSERSTI